MTREEFLDRLAATRDTHRWSLADGWLLRSAENQCPLEAVADLPPGNTGRAIRALGLSYRSDQDADLISEIMTAADCYESAMRCWIAGSEIGRKIYRAPLAMRPRMLDALGLEERTETTT